jgi:hypothetical protein
MSPSKRNRQSNVFCEIANMEITYKEREMTPPNRLKEIKEEENETEPDSKMNNSFSKERVDKLRSTMSCAKKLFNIKTNKDSMIRCPDPCKDVLK